MRIGPSLALSFALLAPSAAHAATVPPPLARALSWIPEDAVSFVAIPDLKRASDDLGQLVEASGQGGVLAMGRPLDLLKAQLGVGASLDEKAPLVAYFPPDPRPAAPAATPTAPVLVVATADAEAFLSANFTADPAAGDDAHRTADGTLWHARRLEGRVALAPRPEWLPAADARGIGERLDARLLDAEREWLERADLVAWGSRDALHAAAEAARAAPLPAAPDGVATPFAGGAEAQEAMRARTLEFADMLADGLVAVDADPLGLFVATLGVAEPGTPLASLLSGGEGRGARFSHLPPAAFYLALAADLDGLGGAAKFTELLEAAGLSTLVPPGWSPAEFAEISAIELAAYPSKLGVAVGGALNDSALFLASRDPARTLASVERAVAAAAGESAGLRREPSWTKGRTLKSGDVADAFEVKETIVDAAQRPSLDYERVAKQFVVGARGVAGLARATGDGVVATFSQRPDVFGRALSAATGGGSLASDEVVASIEEWLPASRDVEAMVSVGRIVGLAKQIAGSFLSREQLATMFPPVDADAEPVAFALDLGGGRARAVLVVPARVLGIAAGVGGRAAAGLAPDAGGEP
ncbi:MAG: hypothetical protein RIS86_852 [Planctomycetota bacterium]|jgi:hypothetical protein